MLNVLFSLTLLIFSAYSFAGAEPEKLTGVYLGELTWKQAEAAFKKYPVVIVPFAAGSKEHGLHLPMDTDQRVMEYLVDQAMASQPVIVVPPVLHGWFPAFRDFPGTEISDPEVFTQYMYEIGLSLTRQGAKRIIFLNTGIFKATGLPISIAARELRVKTGVPILVISWDDLETKEAAQFIEQKAGGHGDEVETSIYLFLESDKVKMPMAKQNYRDNIKTDAKGYVPGVFSQNPDDPSFSDSGSSGDPTLATSEKGRKVLELMSRNFIESIEKFSRYPVRKNEAP